jgi:hypothetical protein
LISGSHNDFKTFSTLVGAESHALAKNFKIKNNKTTITVKCKKSQPFITSYMDSLKTPPFNPKILKKSINYNIDGFSKG